jgi:hypothetical protein
MPLKSVLTVVALIGSLWLSESASLAQSAGIDRPADLRTGTCAVPGELVTTLSNLVVTEGDPQGQSTAMPVEQSGTIVPMSVSALLETYHIVTVQKSIAEPDVIVACGDIGGTRNPDGTLAVGMVGMNGSGLSGIVYFTPNQGFDNILITILLVGGEAPAASTDTTTVSASDAVSGADPVAATDSVPSDSLEES